MAEFLETCEAAARVGGQVLLEWRERFEVREKGPSDLVTQADTAAQESIRSLVLDRYPTHAFVGEEDTAAHAPTGGYCWFVDPLDGTMNYVHGVPHYATSVALARGETLLAAAVFDPNSQECFTAARGEGAYLNGRKLRTSAAAELSRALVAASFSAKVRPDSPEISQFERAMLECQGVRRTGSAALNMCYLAAGRFDTFWSLSTKIWDVAAGVLLVEEAGGVISDIDGQPFTFARPHPVASANPGLHEQFLALLSAANRPNGGKPGVLDGV